MTNGNSAGRAPGTCFGIGVGPGDPELLTLRAARLAGSCPVVAYFSAPGRASHARGVVEGILTGRQAELHFVYPVTTGSVPEGRSYDEAISAFYDAVAEQVGEILADGRDVAVLCEGDPFLHGSFMYLHRRLAPHFPIEVVSGVPSMVAASAAIGKPLVCRDEVLEILTGTLPESELAARLEGVDAAVVMKVGRNLPRVRSAVTSAGLLTRAWYVERVSTDAARAMPLAEADPDAPYFSMVVIPSLGIEGR